LYFSASHLECVFRETGSLLCPLGWAVTNKPVILTVNRMKCQRRKGLELKPGGLVACCG
jgi:hypothetical protein